MSPKLAGNIFVAEDGSLLFGYWREFKEWAATADGPAVAGASEGSDRWSNPVPRPRQIFAIGLNYIDHAAESNMTLPDEPMVFTKFASSLCDPISRVELPDDNGVDWEAEIVAVIGVGGRAISEEDAWGHVAGLTLGQDISERNSQLAGSLPQFSLGKSFAGFAPVGPKIVTPDEFEDMNDISFGCTVNGEEVQTGQTRDMIFSTPAIISRLSQVVEFYPGDLIFTGTPPGVVMGRNPKRYLTDGDELTSRADLIGELRQQFYSKKTAKL
ncbi:Fumarylacetoacetate hydrolase [Arthrobacter sp. 9AX]|nr:Fumarylacetoacetate hydrolase [Arthrobacter sp. 9AX]